MLAGVLLQVESLHLFGLACSKVFWSWLAVLVEMIFWWVFGLLWFLLFAGAWWRARKVKVDSPEDPVVLILVLSFCMWLACFLVGLVRALHLLLN